MMSVQSGIEEKLLQVTGEMHGRYHEFADKNPVSRHRLVNKVLADELKNKIHALALHTYTEQEWYDQNEHAPQSPPCLGGSKS